MLSSVDILLMECFGNTVIANGRSIWYIISSALLPICIPENFNVPVFKAMKCNVENTVSAASGEPRVPWTQNFLNLNGPSQPLP